MSDLGPLSHLRSVLERSFDPEPLFHGPVWSESSGMAMALHKVRQAFSERDARPGQQDIVAAVRNFAAGTATPSFIALKNVCYGVGSADLGNGETLVNRAGLVQGLLSLVQARADRPKQFRRCFQGLLDSYFRADPVVSLDPKRRELWNPIRDFLAKHIATLRRVLRPGAAPLPWIVSLEENKGLLGTRPGDRFAKSFLSGDMSEAKDVAEKLQITRESWIWQEALLSYLDGLTSSTDASFRDRLPGALKVLSGAHNFVWSERLRREATARLVRRYSTCTEKPEHAGLRDVAVQVIGNPWLHKAAWDAHVGNENARRMIESWLKRRLITDFFELLSHDGAANPRRLKYWLQYEQRGQIEDMWFCLGSDARAKTSADFKDVRRRMEGRELALDDSNTSNNAFVMKIGGYLVVEFGVTGNACFVYGHDDFIDVLGRRRVATNGHLKQPSVAISRLTHRGGWEAKFDYEMSRLPRTPPQSNRRQASAPVTAARSAQPRSDARDTTLARRSLPQIIEMCRASSVVVEDRRGVGGALWALADPMRNPVLCKVLEEAGFRHRPGKGFWIKG